MKVNQHWLDALTRIPDDFSLFQLKNIIHINMSHDHNRISHASDVFAVKVKLAMKEQSRLRLFQSREHSHFLDAAVRRKLVHTKKMAMTSSRTSSDEQTVRPPTSINISDAGKFIYGGDRHRRNDDGRIQRGAEKSTYSMLP